MKSPYLILRQTCQECRTLRDSPEAPHFTEMKVDRVAKTVRCPRIMTAIQLSRSECDLFQNMHVSLCESTVVREGASSLTHRNSFLFSPTGCCRETAHWLYSGGAGVKGTNLSQVRLHSTHSLFVIILMIVPLIQLTIGLLTYCAGSDGLTSCAVCTGHSYSSCCKLHTVNYSVV